MKILLITRKFGRSGGIARYTWELTKRFLPKHEVKILTSAYDVSIKNLNIYQRQFKDYPLYLSPILNTIKTSQYVDKIKNTFDIDLIVSNRYESYNADIITMHNCHKAWINRLKKLDMKQKIKTWLNPWNYIVDSLEKKAFSHAEMIITVSNMVKRELLRYYPLSPGKIKVIRNGVDIDTFKPNAAKGKKIRDKYGISQKETLLLFVGGAFKRKGLELLIKAIPKIQDSSIKLLVVGGGPTSFYSQLTKNLEVENKIIFAGFVSAIEDYYQAADIFILPSLYDPFPLTVLEAMASGIPVITSNNVGVAEIITNEKNGILIKEKLTPQAIANKVNFLLSNPEVMKNISQYARNIAKKYSWDKVANRTLNVYKQVLKKKVGD